MKSFNGEAQLKADLIDEMKKHQEADDFLKGTYAKQNGRFKGCAVGCSVQSLIVRRGVKIAHNDHAALGDAIGAPEWLMRLQDTLFENLPEKESKAFPVKFYEAMPVGVNLDPVKWKFCAFILKGNIERVLSLKDIEDNLREQVVTAIQGVLSVHEKAIQSGEWDQSAAESAASAAGSAARSAARSAAWSAESAAYIKYADNLLELLREAA